MGTGRRRAGTAFTLATNGLHVNPHMAAPDSCYPMAMRDRSLASGTPHAAAAVVTDGHARDERTFSVILSLSFCHLLNDMMHIAGARALSHPQDLLRPDFGQDQPDHAGLPMRGLHAATLIGLLYRPPPTTVFPDGRHQPHPGRFLLMSRASAYPAILLAAMLIGMGSSIFHPRSLPCGAHGGRRALWARPVPVPGRRERRLGHGSLLAALIVPHGQSSIAWFSGAALIAIFVLLQVGGWYARNRVPARPGPRTPAAAVVSATAPRPVHVATAEGHPGGGRPRGPALLQERVQRKPGLVLHLLSDGQVPPARPDGAALSGRFPRGHHGGHLAGGAVGDRVGRIPVMWFSILGALPARCSSLMPACSGPAFWPCSSP